MRFCWDRDRTALQVLRCDERWAISDYHWLCLSEWTLSHVKGTHGDKILRKTLFPLDITVCSCMVDEQNENTSHFKTISFLSKHCVYCNYCTHTLQPPSLPPSLSLLVQFYFRTEQLGFASAGWSRTERSELIWQRFRLIALLSFRGPVDVVQR